MAGFVFPMPLQRPLERLAANFMQPSNGPRVDFGQPPGEPALLPPDSLSWIIFKNPLSLAIGGVAAVILELAEPRVRTGVWEHTSFRTAPLPRLQRTGLAAMMTVYGPETQTRAMIERVNRLHGRVAGQTPDGQAYRATDVPLLDWVQATAAFGFVQAYHTHVRPLRPSERDTLYAEGALSAKLYGASGAPVNERQMDALLRAMQPRLEPSPIIVEFLDIMQSAALLPPAMRPVQRLLVRASVSLLPPWAREQLRLGSRWDLRAWESRLLKLMGGGADRLVLRDSPAVQSCLRLGLPADHLYRPFRDI